MSNEHTVYVYQTLRAKGIRDEALGPHEHVKVIPATVHDFREIWVAIGEERYPTLVVDVGNEVSGDNLIVSDAQLGMLDRWEEKYQRREIETNIGKAYVFLLKPKFLLL